MLYQNLFAMNPETIVDFQFKKVKDPLKSKKLKNQQEKVMKALEFIINNIKSWKSLGRLISKLGNRHFERFISYEKYVQYGDALLNVI